MTPLGMPTSMFLVFLATVAAGSLGAVHYVVVHVILRRPFEEAPPPVAGVEPEGHPRGEPGGPGDADG